MFEPQHLVDLQESWDNNSSPTHHQTESSLTHPVPSNVDRVLYKDLVEMIPLVQSLIERKANSSFTRRGSMICTKTPSRKSLSRKVADGKGRNAALPIPVKKKKDRVDNNDSLSIFSSSDLIEGNEKEELIALREQVEDLQKKLMEKEELLKSVEISKNRINDVQAELGHLNRHAAEKDSLIKSIQLQLSDAKLYTSHIKLADEQASLEKTQWEAMTSKQKLEKLQNDIDSMQGEFSSFMVLLNGLTKNNSTACAGDYDVAPYHLEHHPYIDDVDEKQMPKMEEARRAYIAALDAAKVKQDEESLSAAASARLYLQSLLFESEGA